MSFIEISHLAGNTVNEQSRPTRENEEKLDTVIFQIEDFFAEIKAEGWDFYPNIELPREKRHAIEAKIHAKTANSDEVEELNKYRKNKLRGNYANALFGRLQELTMVAREVLDHNDLCEFVNTTTDKMLVEYQRLSMEHVISEIDNKEEKIQLLKATESLLENALLCVKNPNISPA